MQQGDSAGTRAQPSTPDYYKVLQVDPAADMEVIDAAYRRLARKYHPDVYKGADAEERMRGLNAAHAVLSDPLKRYSYDETRKRRTAASFVQQKPPDTRPPAAAPQPVPQPEQQPFRQPVGAAAPGASAPQWVMVSAAQAARRFSSSKMLYLLARYPFLRVIALADTAAIGLGSWLGVQTLWLTGLLAGCGIALFLLSAGLTRNSLVIGAAGVWAVIWFLVGWSMSASGLVLPLAWPMGGLLLAFLAFLIHLFFLPALLPGLAASGRARRGR